MPGRDPRKKLGRCGEAMASVFLRAQGYQILARNLRTPAAEVDILARDAECLVIVEVKTRSRKVPEVEISHSQRRRLARAALWVYGRWGNNAGGVRVDLLAVQFTGPLGAPKLDLYRGVLGEDEIR